MDSAWLIASVRWSMVFNNAGNASHNTGVTVDKTCCCSAVSEVIAEEFKIWFNKSLSVTLVTDIINRRD
jgi:hypothetical protein